MSDMYPFALRVKVDSASKVEMELEWARLVESRWYAIRANERGSIDACDDSMRKLGEAYQRRFGENSQPGSEEIRDLILAGLNTDGGHHKQWYLEQIGEKLGIDVADLRREAMDKYGYTWDPGIAP